MNDVALLLPEIVLAGAIALVLLSDVVLPPRLRGHAAWIGVLACAVGLAFSLGAPRGAIESMLLIDGTTLLARPAICITTLLVLVAGSARRRGEEDEGAWTIMLLGLGLGACLCAASANLVMLWLGLETMSLCSYALAAWRVRELRPAEAGMKFVLFGGVATGLTLFGMSHVYGTTGHLDFAGIGIALGNGMPITAIASLCLAGVGIAYKLSLVPFHFYAPDVYQGAPALSVAAVSVAPKIAALAVLVRLLQSAVPPGLVPLPTLQTALVVAASLSLLSSAFLALAQRDAKRILAFSSIGHAGAALLAVVRVRADGASVSFAAYYLAAYGVANLGALISLAVLERDRGTTALDRIAGAVRTHPVVTAALCTFLLSLAGLPPLAGFLGKWGVLMDCLRQGDGGRAPLFGAIALLCSTAVSAWAYLVVIRSVLLAEPPATLRNASERAPRSMCLVIATCLLGTLALGLWLDGFVAMSRTAVG
ncbi:MAG: NADH-quinone oxidoreductase subunit N [Planctomycetota bacterium]